MCCKKYITRTVIWRWSIAGGRQRSVVDRRAVESLFGRAAFGCKSGGEAAHSKVDEELRRRDFADMRRSIAAPLRRQTPRAQSLRSSRQAGVTMPQEKPKKRPQV